MKKIQFRTTPKGDLTQYSLIFSNADPLVIQLKNVTHYSLVNML